jgi:hypothetical protein
MLFAWGQGVCQGTETGDFGLEHIPFALQLFYVLIAVLVFQFDVFEPGKHCRDCH